MHKAKIKGVASKILVGALPPLLHTLLPSTCFTLATLLLEGVLNPIFQLYFPGDLSHCCWCAVSNQIQFLFNIVCHWYSRSQFIKSPKSIRIWWAVERWHCHLNQSLITLEMFLDSCLEHGYFVSSSWCFTADIKLESSNSLPHPYQSFDVSTKASSWSKSSKSTMSVMKCEKP